MQGSQKPKTENDLKNLSGPSFSSIQIPHKGYKLVEKVYGKVNISSKDMSQVMMSINFLDFSLSKLNIKLLERQHGPLLIELNNPNQNYVCREPGIY